MYTSSSIKFEVFTKKDYLFWRKDFEQLRKKIIAGSSKRSINYSHKRMDIDKLDEITVLYVNDKVVAFSSLFQSPFYPKNVARVLNRTWKAPSFRWKKPAYYIISRLMLRSQLEVAHKMGYDFVFLSTEGARHNYWKRWKSGADRDFPKWTVHPGMVQVCYGSYSTCWQSVVYKNLKNKPTTTFPMKSISLLSWKWYALK